MKRIFFAVMFVVALTVTQTCAAADVWVSKWHSNDVDLYVMNETIKSDTSDTGYKHFTVSTKAVKNGQLQEIINWEFDKLRTDDWQFTHSRINGDGRYKVVYRSGLFEYCMNYLGWSYRITDRNGTKYYH